MNKGGGSKWRKQEWGLDRYHHGIYDARKLCETCYINCQQVRPRPADHHRRRVAF